MREELFDRVLELQGQIDEEEDLEMAEAVQFAEKSPFPSGESLEGSLFA